MSDFRNVFSITELKIRRKGDQTWVNCEGLQSGTLTMSGKVVTNYGGESIWPLAQDVSDADATITIGLSKIGLELMGMLWGTSVSSNATSRVVGIPATPSDVYFELLCKAQADGRSFGYHALKAKVNPGWTITFTRGAYAVPEIVFLLMVDPDTNKLGFFFETIPQ